MLCAIDSSILIEFGLSISVIIETSNNSTPSNQLLTAISNNCFSLEVYPVLLEFKSWYASWEFVRILLMLFSNLSLLTSEKSRRSLKFAEFELCISEIVAASDKN